MVAKPDSVYRLRDGRLLGYAEFGDPRGRPLFFLHGFPGARLGARFVDAAAERNGVRIIAPDRPGFGLSDGHAGRRLLGWPDDVLELAGGLGIERFAVLGVSGGGPYAAACAYQLPQRLTGAAIVSGLAPLDRPNALEGMALVNRLYLRLARRSAALVRPGLWLLSRFARRFPRLLLWLASRRVPPSDRAIAARPEIKTMFVEDVPEAFRQGSGGAARELALFARPWGFPLADVRMQVHLWQGEADTIVPAQMGRHQAETIPNCSARFYPGEGHLLIVDRIEEVLRALFPDPATDT